MNVRSQRASIRTTGTAPQILPPAASSLPSSRFEVRTRVAQNDLWLHSDSGLLIASRSVNLLLPKCPRGAYFVVLSDAGCKVGRRSRQRGFLDGWSKLNFDRVRRSSQAPFRCSDWPCARRSALPILCLLDRLSCLRDESKMVKSLGSETSLAAHSFRQPAVQTCTHLHPRPGFGLVLSCLMSGARHRFVCLETPWKQRSKLIAGHCDYHNILSLAECSCEEHHVCAYSRRPHFQLHGSDLDGRQFTARCQVLPFRLCSKLCNIIISRETGNR